MEESNLHILCTRPLEESLLQQAALAGIAITVQPFIQTLPIRNAETEALVTGWASRKATVIFTSSNAVNAIAPFIAACQPQWEVFCIGEATRKAVEALLPASAIKGTAPDGARLAQVIIEQSIIQPLVFFCGDIRRETIPAALKEAGISLTEVVVYETKPTPVVLQEPFDGIMFFSPSAVSAYFSLNTLHPKTVLFAIGGTTADALKQVSDNQIIIAKAPAAAAMITELIHFYKAGTVSGN